MIAQDWSMKIENWSIVVVENGWDIEIKMIENWSIEIAENFLHSLFEFENRIFMKKGIVKNVMIVDVDVDVDVNVNVNVDRKRWKLRQVFKKKNDVMKFYETIFNAFLTQRFFLRFFIVIET